MAHLQELKERVLTFWFKETTQKQRFVRDDAFDVVVKEKFAGDLERAVKGEYDELHASSAEGSLAVVILIDQFSRNIFRDDPRAFSGDTKSLALVLDGILRGFDKEIGADDKWKLMFYLLPLQHSEDLAVQEKSIELYTAHGMEKHGLEYAITHRDIIKKFGRFPHRNQVLGRESTKEENDYLESEGALFGKKSNVATATDSKA
eukprot:c10753_g1_i2.p1 GENE.c10753_g1_i2~~c10753_g1_i2.p1  ORF type:complete len:221 (-),score=53.67 c10753_g1_i2:321-932(-)